MGIQAPNPKNKPIPTGIMLAYFLCELLNFACCNKWKLSPITMAEVCGLMSLLGHLRKEEVDGGFVVNSQNIFWNMKTLFFKA